MGFFDWIRGRVFGAPQRRDNYAGTYGNGSPGGFSAAAVNRLTDSLATWSGSISNDLDGSIAILRARGRQLAANNEYGRRFLNLVAANIVGRAGPKLQVRAYKDQRDPTKPTTLDKSANDAVEIHWERWGKKADIAGRMSFPLLLRVAAKAVARDGEAVVRIVRDRKLPYGLALQLLEADRLDDALNISSGTTTIRQGVEIDSTGRAVALWLKTRHPGDNYGTASQNERERVPMADVIHVFLPERAEQVRGYTWFHAILLRAQQLHGFNDAAVTAARIGASKVAALERSDDAADVTALMADGVSSGGFSMNVEAGEMFELPPGYKLSSWNPDYPHANFESFVKAAMRGISSGLDVATHNLSGDMTDVNYSSARIAELAERDQWLVLQDWFISTLVEPVFQEWLASALLRGDITFEISGKSLPADKLGKFSAAAGFQGRRWRWIDPAKEIAAAKEGVALGVISRTRIAAEQGDDIEDIFDELTVEQDLMQSSGLQAAEPVPAAAPAIEDIQPPTKALEDGIAAMHAAVLAMLAREQPAPVNNFYAAPIPPTEVRNEITVQPAVPAAVEVRNEITVPEREVHLEAVINNQPVATAETLPSGS